MVMNDKIWSTIFILHVIFVRFLYQGYAVVVKKKKKKKQVRELSVSILWKTLSKIGDIFLNACLIYKITCVCVCMYAYACLCIQRFLPQHFNYNKYQTHGKIEKFCNGPPLTFKI